MTTPDIVRDFNSCNRLQRQAKRADAKDSSMNKKRRAAGGARAESAARRAARQNQQLVGQLQSASSSRAP